MPAVVTHSRYITWFWSSWWVLKPLRYCTFRWRKKREFHLILMFRLIFLSYGVRTLTSDIRIVLNDLLTCSWRVSRVREHSLFSKTIDKKLDYWCSHRGVSLGQYFREEVILASFIVFVAASVRVWRASGSFVWVDKVGTVLSGYMNEVIRCFIRA